MTITIPTSAQLGAGAERIARTLAVAVAWVILAAQVTYEAGYALGRIVHSANDWLARASHAPMAETTRVAVAAVAWADKVTAPAPATFAEVMAAEGIRPLTPAKPEAEIVKPARRKAATPKTAARRKPATARKAKTAA